jgi:FHA domain
VTEHGVLPGLWPIHGDGVLARQGDLVLLIHPAGGAFTDRLIDLLANVARAGGNGLRFTDLVSAEFDADASAADITAGPGPAVVAFGPAGGGTAVAVYGTGWAEVTTAYGEQRLTTGEPYGRLRCVLPSALIKVRAGVQPVADDPETDPYLRLADGVVRAVALIYAPAEIEAEAADQARPAIPAPAVTPAVPAAEQGAEQPAEQPPAAAEQGAEQPAGQPPAAVEQPAEQPLAAAEQPAEQPPAVPEPVFGQVQQAGPEPYADQIEEPEPEYHATRVEPAAAMPPARPALPDPYGSQPPPPELNPYLAPAPDPYAAQAPPLAPDPYADQGLQPAPGPAAGPLAAGPLAAGPLPAGPLAGGPPGGPPPDFISISLVPDQPGGGVPQRDPLPLGAEPPEAKDLGLIEMPSAQIEGVYCKNGHFNDPEARYCAVCGISMGQLTKIRQKGNRPPLGVLVLGDGSVCQLDADYVIGREPTLDSAVAEGRARPLRLMGASGVVSRIHARVELDGWQVYITDLNSANGTQVLLPGERNPTNLQPGARTPLVAGAQIRLGGEYGLQYDSHRHR